MTVQTKSPPLAGRAPGLMQPQMRDPKTLVRKAIGLGRDQETGEEKEPTFNQQLAAAAWIQMCTRHPQLRGRIKVRVDFRNKRLRFAARRRGPSHPLTTAASIRLCVGPQHPWYQETLRRAADAALAIIRGQSNASEIHWEEPAPPGGVGPEEQT